MAKRNDLVSRARGRKPTPVRKPLPTGQFALFGITGLLCAGLITYGAFNVSLGDKSSLTHARANDPSGTIDYNGLTHNHTAGNVVVNYKNASTTPPAGGDHDPQPQSCQVYTQPIANEHAVHSLEHGAVWITYNPATASKDDIAKLKSKADGNADRLMSPYPGLKTKVSLQAWGEQLFVDSATDKRIDQFLTDYTKGPQTREVNGACVGVTTTGSITEQKSATPTTPPTSAPTTAPSASASPKK